MLASVFGCALCRCRVLCARSAFLSPPSRPRACRIRLQPRSQEARQAVEAQLSTFHSAGVSSVEALRDLQSEVVRAKAQCSELLQAQSDTEEKQKSVLGDVQRLQVR